MERTWNLDDIMTNKHADHSESVDPTVAGLTRCDDGHVYYRGLLLALSPKEEGVLNALLEHWPGAVSKDQFAERVWPGASMSDESLARCITQLRRSLKTVSGLQVDALYGRGYMLTITLPRQQGPYHARLLDAAKSPPHLTETFLYTRNLIERRTVHSLLQAETTLRDAIRDAPDYMPARMAFAECAAGAINCGASADPGILDEALEWLEPLRADDAPVGALWSQMAHLQDTRWRFREARMQHERAVLAAPDDATIRYHFGWHLLAVNKPLDAIRQFERAIKLNPYSPVISTMLARAAASAGDIPTAFIYSRRAYAAHPDSPQAYLYLLSLEAFAKPRPELARAAKRLGIDNARWTFGPSTLSYIFARCGDRKHALEIIALSAGGNANFRATHAAALTALGMNDEAMKLVKASVETGCGFLPLMLNSPQSDALRHHVGYRSISARLYSNLEDA